MGAGRVGGRGHLCRFICACVCLHMWMCMCIHGHLCNYTQRKQSVKTYTKTFIKGLSLRKEGILGDKR